MLETSDLSATLRMIGEENLDVRTVTLGVNLNICANPDGDKMATAVYERLCRVAERLVPVANEVGARYGVEIVNKRLAVSPCSILLEPHTVAIGVKLAKAMDRACETVGVDLLGMGAVRPGQQGAFAVKNHALGALGTLVNGQNVRFHRTSSRAAAAMPAASRP